MVMRRVGFVDEEGGDGGVEKRGGEERGGGEVEWGTVCARRFL